MVLDKGMIIKMLSSSCDLLDENIEKLSEIDGKFGDGDHGITMSKISKVVRKCMESWKDESLSNFFDDLGEKIMNVNGGSAGPLYGTFFQGLGEGAEDAKEITGEVFKAMIVASKENMETISKAKVGDKTMMDTLIPAAECASSSVAELPGLIDDIAEAACKGAENSKKFPSKYGRAKFFKDETIGYMDAGAMSLNFIFKGFSDGIKKGG